MTEALLLDLLAKRHAADVFVPHCKNGPTNTVGAKVAILDGWALLSTWSPLTSVGYEVKVSRSDWLRDQKFATYLPLCHLFFVVAPRGVVLDGELPHGVGLLETIGTGTGMRLVTRRKAARRDVEMPVNLMAYALMWRTERVRSKAHRAEEFRARIDEARSARTIGLYINGQIGQKMSALEAENQMLATRMRTYDDVRAALVALGLDPNCVSSWGVENQVRAASIHARLGDLASRADDLARRLRELGTPTTTEQTA